MIYIVMHKRVKLPMLKGYRPIQVGYAAEDFPGCLRDNIGYSIAEKNANYCEMTAVYWVWKNIEDDYKGIAHYRRYFGRRPFSSSARDILSEEALKEKLRGHDIVLARPALYHISARDQLLRDCCTRETYDMLRQIVIDLDAGCRADFDAFFEGNRVCQYNMLFCGREVFDAYCAWLFPILFRLEDQVDLSAQSDYRKRLYGFLSERLLNVWVLHNGLKPCYAPVVSTEYTPVDHLTYFRRDITNDLRFRMNREPKQSDHADPRD